MRDCMARMRIYGYTAGADAAVQPTVHESAAHDDALVPNIDDIPGEQGYVQYGAYAYFMHSIGPDMV
ncbi:hypothetical protein V494_07146 [Pseudogymnoascus sp. VKM F-4513 (FW-928)]|nr:hypothetical protein V494_07146 [Pseudogymnoascus sp. VKM F-4513 (FW-928)]